MTQQQRGRRGLIILLVALASGIAVLDQVTKYLAEARLTQGVLVPLVGDFLGLQLIYNPGAAFSLATGMTWVFTVITIGVVVVVLRVSRRLRSPGWAVALGLLLGGALGNLYDRMFREPGLARGHVVDFINYNGWFVGNVADIAIVVAAVLIALLALRGIEVDGTRASSTTENDDAEDDPAGDAEEDLGEEPLGDEEDFSPEVPRATGDGVDLASWVAGAPPASATAPSDQRSTGDAQPEGARTGQRAGPDEPRRPAWARTGASVGTPGGAAGKDDPAGAADKDDPAGASGEDDPAGVAGKDAAAGASGGPVHEEQPAPRTAAAPRDVTGPGAPSSTTSPVTEPAARPPRRLPSRREIRLAGRAEDDG